MELRLLRYFLVVAAEGNITRAAEKLYITQPTLSRQMNQLEEEAGAPLFKRPMRRVELTEEGLLLKRRAEEIVALVGKTKRELADANVGVDGVVSVSCGEIEAVQLLADLFKAFKERHPAVTFELYAANAEHTAERLENGLADIGIFFEPADLERYEYIRLPVKERWAVLLPADDPLAEKTYIEASNLAGKNIIFPWRAAVHKELKNWFGKYFSRIHPVAKCNMSTNASVLVRKGLGYSLCIGGGRPFLDERQVCRRYLYPSIEIGTVLVWKKYAPASITVAKFLDFVHDYVSGQKA